MISNYSAERSFSKLKFIWNRLRTAMKFSVVLSVQSPKSIHMEQVASTCFCAHGPPHIKIRHWVEAIRFIWTQTIQSRMYGRGGIICSISQPRQTCPISQPRQTNRWLDSWIYTNSSLINPFRPAKAPNLAEHCNPITRQAIGLESYPNHPRIQQVL